MGKLVTTEHPEAKGVRYRRLIVSWDVGGVLKKIYESVVLFT